jgi:cytoskeletal protein RodZ
MSEQVLHLNQQQAVRLSEIGQYLQEVRQRQQMTLEQVAEKTMIPVRTLSAIEAGRLEQLPEPVYVQGFIRRFADAIGVNGAEFASAFPTEIALNEHHTGSWQGTVQAQLRPLHLYLLYAGLVMVGISGLSFLLNRSSNPQVYGLKETAQPLPSATTGVGTLYGPLLPPSSTSPQTNSLGVSPVFAPTLSQKPVRVDLTVTAQSWIRVMVDGKTDFEGMLSEGTQRSWTADKQVTVRAGNAGGVTVKFNDQPEKHLGAPGEVEEVTFESKANSVAKKAP